MQQNDKKLIANKRKEENITELPGILSNIKIARA